MTRQTLLPIEHKMAASGEDFVNIDLRRLGAAHDHSAFRQSVNRTPHRTSHSKRELRRVDHFHKPAANIAAEFAGQSAVVQSAADLFTRHRYTKRHARKERYQRESSIRIYCASNAGFASSSSSDIARVH